MTTPKLEQRLVSFVYIVFYTEGIYTVKLKIEINNLDIRLTSYTYPKLFDCIEGSECSAVFMGAEVHVYTCHTC